MYWWSFSGSSAVTGSFDGVDGDYDDAAGRGCTYRHACDCAGYCNYYYECLLPGDTFLHLNDAKVGDDLILLQLNLLSIYWKPLMIP